MIKHFFKLMILFLVLISNTAGGQAFSVQTSNGKNQMINVLFHNETGILTISALRDTITIKDCNDLTGKIENLNKSLLKISYSNRGGTGIHLQRTVILCVNGRHLIQSLHVTSMFDEEFIDFSKPVDTANLVDDKSVYELGLNLKESIKRHYILGVKIREEKKSKPNPQTNYNRDSEVYLSYDSTRNIFYSTHENVSRYFTVYDPKTGEDTKRYIMGTFPVVKLGEYEYYFIKNEWYEKNKYDDLTKY